jgi:RNA polymerase sigma factor (sigma-70 family)
LFSSIADNSREAFHQLFQDYFQTLYATALTYTKVPEQAQDIVQNVFLKVWEKRSSLKAIKQPGDWLFIVARNEIMNGSANKCGTGSGIARPTASLYNLFTAADKRKDVTFMSSYVFNNVTTTLSITDADSTKAVGFQKLWDRSAKTSGGNGTSFPVMLFAEILLMYAEALNEANSGPTPESYAALNRVRTRAGLSAVSGLNYQSFKNAVWLERRLEFVFEEQRRFDLVRTGRLLDAVKAENSFSRNAAIQPFHVYLPIPQLQIDVNPSLTQNPGY